MSFNISFRYKIFCKNKTKIKKTCYFISCLIYWQISNEFFNPFFFLDTLKALYRVYSTGAYLYRSSYKSHFLRKLRTEPNFLFWYNRTCYYCPHLKVLTLDHLKYNWGLFLCNCLVLVVRKIAYSGNFHLMFLNKTSIFLIIPDAARIVSNTFHSSPSGSFILDILLQWICSISQAK